MKSVGTIDIDKFKLISTDIASDEVILTEKQIMHIKENHPGDYENYGKYIPQIIKTPDYILEANLPHSAVLLKSFHENDRRFQLVLRLKISSDPREYKNSVITFMRINNKRYERYLRARKILYKA